MISSDACYSVYGRTPQITLKIDLQGLHLTIIYTLKRSSKWPLFNLIFSDLALMILKFDYSDFVSARSTSHFANLELNNFQSIEKALNCFMELKYCNSDAYFLSRRKNVQVVTYNFGSECITLFSYYCHLCISLKGSVDRRSSCQ